MKKTYMIPEMIQVKLSVQPLLQLSTNTSTLNTGEAGSETVGFGRDFGFGGDEEE